MPNCSTRSGSIPMTEGTIDIISDMSLGMTMRCPPFSRGMICAPFFAKTKPFNIDSTVPRGMLIGSVPSGIRPPMSNSRTVS